MGRLNNLTKHINYENNNPAVGVGVLVIRNDQLLLLKRKNAHGSGTWSTPGGHLDFGESPEECAIREVKEETGVSIKELKFKAITNDIFKSQGKHYITIWLEAKHLSGEPMINAPYEVAEVGWFKLDSLPKPLFMPFRNLLTDRCYPSIASHK